ncbi:hybrid sensor histidine kinase/response regulator transcription factor [Pedobacter borealis]|uniref:hybrid sensor histidine kinase/response regulator transcription factor n=1 Tax=Pedobacter borealis TaxID=475254 RepID=UPI00049317C1|nr:two-component regulator propeller domain-containing protein [Pedobacter borealis]
MFTINETKYFFYILLLCALSTYSHAQTPYIFNHLNIEDGLSQNSVLAIIKDPQGFMWFGTRYGLNRYDGQNIKVFKNTTVSKKSVVSNNYITTLAVDDNKVMWVGSLHSLDKYDPKSGTFIHVLSDVDRSNYLYNDRKGTLWLGTDSGLLYSTDKFHNKFKRLKLPIKKSYKVLTIFEDHLDNLWIGTTSGLVRLEKLNGRYQCSIFAHSADPNSISSSVVTAIAEDKKNRLWIGTKHNGLNLYEGTGKFFRHYSQSENSPNTVGINHIQKITADRNGKLWIGTQEGISLIDTEKMKFENYQHDSSDPVSLGENSVFDIYEDNCGSIWIGTYFGGVDVVHAITTPFQVYQNDKYKNSISNNVISAIAEDRINNLWIATNDGLNYFNRKTGRFTIFKNADKSPNSLSSNVIKTILVDRSQRVWVGNYQGGLNLFRPETNDFIRYRHLDADPMSLSYDDVNCIVEDNKGGIWVATSMGLNLFDPGTNRFKLVYTDNIKKNELIRVLYEDSKHNIWIGSNNIHFWNSATNTFKSFIGGKTPGLVNGVVNCFYEDKTGAIWFGTDHGGLSVYDPKKNAFRTFSQKDGLPSDNILSLLEDDYGFLWLSTERGLIKFDKEHQIFKLYNTKDGLPGNVFNIGSGFKDRAGQLFFGGYNGLVGFYPEEIRENDSRPAVMLTSLKVFDKLIGIKGPDSLLKKAIELTGEITFSSEQNVFTIGFSALNYIKPEKNRYKYKLEGFDKNWNEDVVPFASYSNLRPGQYTFLVNGSNNDGLWSVRPAKLIINILPPLWLTWWAYLIYGVVLFAVSYYVFRFFKNREKLERELYLEHREAEQQQALYQTKLDFFTNVSHEIRTPLTLIIGPIEKLIDLTSENEAVRKPLQNIRRNTDRLFRLVTELLDFRKVESDKLPLYFFEQNIVDFAGDIFLLFQNLASQKNINYTIECSEDKIFAYFDKDQLEKVFFNLLSNAFKFSDEGGEINLLIRKGETGDQVEIIVTNNGKGINMENLDRIFDNFYQVNESRHYSIGTGIGLALSKSIVELHHGHIHAESVAIDTEHYKTSFKVILPLGRAHLSDDLLLDGNINTRAEQDSSYHRPIIEVLDDNQTAGVPIGKTYTVLLVEDNEELRNFIQRLLDKKYDVVTCSNGMEGWDTAVRIIPDLIISDVMMPVMDGLELCKKLKTDNRTSHIPIILLTARAASIHQVSGLQNGADAYITKPFSDQILQLNIQNMLALRAAMQARFGKQLLLEPANNPSTKDEELLGKIMVAVDKNLDNPEFDLMQLTLEIGMSKSVLYKKFNALTDVSLTDFVKSQRLKRAAVLLQKGEYNPTEVTYMVGFSDPKYFSKEFRKVYGVTPYQYLHPNP